MRWTARRTRDGRKPVRLFAVFAAIASCAVLILVPTDGGAASGLAKGLGLLPSRLATPSQTSRAFGGVAAVGALFTMSSRQLGTHFCTASVIHSPHGNLAVTAAHCVTGTDKPGGQIVFVPGYANGKEPYGVWQVTRVYTDKAWQSSQDPADDVAFLRLSSASDGVPIEDVTGAELLGTGSQADTLVQVIGYPDGAVQPVWCANRAKSFSPTQLEFDCAGYTDGTSGSPFLADVSTVTGEGTIIGVIGGYEQGGDTPEVSYASVLGTAVASLYLTAEAGG
jgi:V8-like Glu-specific endopeptidase